MLSASISRIALALLSILSLVSAHVVITYPGWRGDNLHSNGTVEETNGLGSYAVDDGQEYLWPYGMQWMYPCKTSARHEGVQEKADTFLQVAVCQLLRTVRSG